MAIGHKCSGPLGRGISRRSGYAALLLWVATLSPVLAITGCTGMVNGQNKTGESAVQVVPATVNFGSTGVGKKVSHPATVANNGKSTVVLTKATVSSADFSISGLQFPLSILPGQKANFTVWFKRSKAGKGQGTLSFTGDTDSPDPVDLSGTAGSTGPQLTVSATNQDFGKVTVDKVANASLTLTNTGAADLTVSTVSVSGATFAATGVQVPATVHPGASAALNLTFSPKTAGNYSGSVSIGTDDPASPTTKVTLSGVATAEAVGTLTATPAALSFSNVQVGTSGSAVTTVKNTGTGNVTLSEITSNSASFSTSGIATPVLMTPGETLALTVKFGPTAAGTKSGNIALVNSQGGITSVSVSGTAVQSGLTVSPGTISFGNVVANQTNTQTVQISNPSAVSVTITAANITGTGFGITGLSLPLTLNAGKTSTFNVQFNPKAAGSVTGTLSLVSNASNSPSALALSGQGIAAGLTLSATPSSVSFGNVTTGTTASKSITVTNTGNSDVAISSVTITGSKLTLTGGSAVSLAPSQSITLTVQFAPTTAGAVTGSVSIASNAAGSPATIPVSATGVATPVQHTVSLSWNASASAAGYNVYRSGTSGAGYSKLNSALDGSLTYGDSTVQNGHTYFYVTTAVDGSGNESGFSSEVSANIP